MSNATLEEVDENTAPGDAKSALEEVSGAKKIGVFKNQRRKKEKED